MTTDLRPFATLDPDAQDRVVAFAHAFAPRRWPSPSAAWREFTGPSFEHGATLFTLWRGEAVRGTLGVVLREIPVKQQAYITAVAVPEGDPAAFAPLIAHALDTLDALDDPDAVRVALGLAPLPHLAALAEAAGFTPHEDALRLVLHGPGPTPPPRPDLRFTPLTAADAERFRAVANAAFLDSPNGATLDADEVAALLADAAHPEHVGLYHLGAGADADAVGFHILAHGGVDGTTGEIDTVGLVPAARHQGLGAHLLAHALATLRAHGATALTLTVMSSNAPAVRLYTRHGFVLDEVTARWFVRRNRGERA